MGKTYIYLAIAIITEVIATTVLKSSRGFTNLLPTVVALSGYAVAFYFLSIVMETMPVGISYAIWAGVGTILTVLISWFFYNQKLDITAMIGLGLIVIGIIVVNLSSAMNIH